MNLPRLIARSMVAGYFVADGVAAITHPDRLVPQAERLATRIHAVAQRVLPPSVAQRIPEDTRAFVRFHAGVQTAGAIMLATGVGRRLGATVLAISYLPKVLSARPNVRSLNNSTFLKDVALMGAVVVCAMDTQGKPNLAWLANDRKQQLVRASAKLVDTKKDQARKAVESKKAQAVGFVDSKRHDGVKAAKRAAKKAATKVRTLAQETTEALGEAIASARA